MQQDFCESQEFVRPPKDKTDVFLGSVQNREKELCQYVLSQSQKGNPADVIDKIDHFCEKNWMMNLGPEKGSIVKMAMKGHPIKKVIEIGGYCGYSALVFANQIKDLEGAKVFTIEVNEYYAGIARKILEHAGVSHLVEINLNTVENSSQFIKKNGPYDMVFIDHIKNLYLSDFLLLEEYGVLKSGALVVGDNIITPGSPEYLQKMKENKNYKSILYHTFLEYCDIPDAVLVSVKK